MMIFHHRTLRLFTITRTRTFHVINKRCTRFGCTTRMKYYITLYYFIPISIQDFFIYINLVNFLSCLKVNLYIIWSTFGGFFGGKSPNYTSPFSMNINNVCIYLFLVFRVVYTSVNRLLNRCISVNDLLRYWTLHECLQ
jgi:hypothetical protein